MNNQAVKKIRFEKSAIFYVPLIIFILGGFWRGYFSRFFNWEQFSKITFYTHFHFLMVSLWVVLLIIQPILIRQKKVAIHKKLGRISYILMPLIFVSVLLLFHSRHKPNGEGVDLDFFIPLKDLIIMGIAYFIAIKYRKRFDIHARAMIATGIPFIEPALSRLMSHNFPTLGLTNYFITCGVMHLLLIVLIILERKQKSARWVFPLIWGIYLVFHFIAIFDVHIPGLKSLANWFLSLPLT
ncbi:hypothetical protein SAMN04515674_104105 [Pseudarcicella hirudinis]|uniref:Uncharacterized protein n=1 Tax=Pseudarcicella hirudinis TaxID=1079859 RepID=A0A1I5RJA0_9BACT|nr:hypothetical protein [Pseudarcicella hirudinis]SFP58593.1 hypothetical protein SAMN04515674_104105 [Pseudarcicella hirudinis]